MRRRIFLSLVVFLLLLPLAVLLVSYTRAFNDEIRNILTSVVDSQTNAHLYLGEIRGSLLRSFTIDGAALMCDGKPIVLVDTVKVTYSLFSLITKSVDAVHVELVSPRFHLIKLRDGTMNLDHISKTRSRSGGKFDWTINVRDLTISGGQFIYFDSTSSDPPENLGPPFDASHFNLKGISLDGDAEISGESITTTIRNFAFEVDPADFRIDSLRFELYTSPGATELSGFSLKSQSTSIHADVTLLGQSLLDPIDVATFRRKSISANIEARGVELRDLEKFIKLPLDPPSRANLSLYASGSLDTLNVRRLVLSTDSSTIPVTATLYNIVDSSFRLNALARDAFVNTTEAHSLLKNLGVPEFHSLGTARVDAGFSGFPSDFTADARLRSGPTDVKATFKLTHDGYGGSATFRGLDLGELFQLGDGESKMQGTLSFSFNQSGKIVPGGEVTVDLDSSYFEHTDIGKSSVNVESGGDSVRLAASFLTSNGNVSGNAVADLSTKSYSAKFSLSEFNVGPFTGDRDIASSITGTLDVLGQGYSLDSMNASLSLLTENSSFGSTPLNDVAFLSVLNTRNSSRSFLFRSPFVDADVSGNFTPAELPGELAKIFSTLAERFSAKITGAPDSVGLDARRSPPLNATVDVEVKNAGIVEEFMRNTKIAGKLGAHLDIANGDSVFSVAGSLTVDTLSYTKDSTRIFGSGIGLEFNVKSDEELSVWNTGSWSTAGKIQRLDLNGTSLSADTLRASYAAPGSLPEGSLSLAVRGGVDTTIQFYVDATARVLADSISISTRTLSGKILGYELRATSPADITYKPETFIFAPIAFTTADTGQSEERLTSVQASGRYSLRSGANMHLNFARIPLEKIEQIAKLDTTSLDLRGNIDGDASVDQSSGGLEVSTEFSGTDIVYNGERAKYLDGSFLLGNDHVTVSARLSKQTDSTDFALRLNGDIPLSSQSSRKLHLNFVADSLDVSFLMPFLSGVQNFGGFITGEMTLGGDYSYPTFDGKMQISSGRLKLSANEIGYQLDGSLVGSGNQLLLPAVYLRNLPGEGGGTMQATGSLTIGDNTIRAFNVGLDGTLMILNSTAQRSLHGIYGSLVVGSGPRGLKLGGSLDRPLLEGGLAIQSADLTLLGLQKGASNANQEIIYHFPAQESSESTTGPGKNVTADPPSGSSSGSVVDSLRYDLEIETKDNVSLRMVFDQATNEELYAILGGRLHLSNLSGSMELNGDVNVLNNSYYTFYRQFAATGRLSFTGDPLNPSMDITAAYQGEHSDTSASGPPQVVVVQLKITGSFNAPSVNISMTVDNAPYTGDVQTNAISFIVFNQFEDELTSTSRRSAADNIMSQAGAGVLTAGSSVLSGMLTNFLGREFSFITSAGLRYTSISNITDPELSITGRIGPAIIRLGGQVFSDINNTDVSVDYPLTQLFGNRLYLELSRQVSLTSRSYYQRETINMLKVFYQLSF